MKTWTAEFKQLEKQDDVVSEHQDGASDAEAELEDDGESSDNDKPVRNT